MATAFKNGEICVQNVNLASNRKSLNDFYE